MEEIKPTHVPKVILYDMVSNTLPNGIIFNDILLKEGFAKKDTKSIFHGLLPWEHPDLQCRQLNIDIDVKKEDASPPMRYSSFDAPNVGSSSASDFMYKSFASASQRTRQRHESFMCPKESFSKVIRWLPGCNTTTMVRDDKDFVSDQDLGLPPVYY